MVIQDFALDLPLAYCGLHRMHRNMLVCIQVFPLLTATLDGVDAPLTPDGAGDPPGPGYYVPASPADSQATLQYSVPASPADSQATLRYSVPASPADSQATLRYSQAVPASPADSQATLRYSVPASPADSQATMPGNFAISFPASPAETFRPEPPSSSSSPSRRVRRRIGYA